VPEVGGRASTRPDLVLTCTCVGAGILRSAPPALPCADGTARVPFRADRRRATRDWRRAGSAQLVGCSCFGWSTRAPAAGCGTGS